jgi:hypothetical protein
VRIVTGQLTASNYKSEHDVAVYETMPGGPFFTNKDVPDMVRPTKGFVLTKTHCTGYCSVCAPEFYIVNATEFTQSCFEGDSFLTDEGDETVYSYSPDLVQRAVHIIRDPFDNIVSRFHLMRENFSRRNQTELVVRHPKTKAGFRSYCKYMGERFYKEHLELFDEVIKDIPCFSDFFRYIQWHNLAFTTTEDLRSSTLIIHYEDYLTKLDQTKDALLEFLGQDGIRDAPPFETGKSYREYFTKDEIQAVSRMFSKLASQKTWDQTNHYFVQ